MAVWQFVEMAREFNGDAALMARHLDFDASLVAEALWYAAEHPDEIRQSPIDEDEAATLARLRQMLPDLEVRHSHPDE
ncbi:MAG TPA: hypothetical protein VFA78_06695 [Chloroflexota bacterium]|nr:hypothetical protein [Chloroflexota bacterium]